MGFIIYLFKEFLKSILKIKDELKFSRLKFELLKKKVFIQKKAIVDMNTNFEGKNLICSNTKIRKCNVGFGTYFGTNCFFEFANIGKYCSIASEVKIVGGHHPTNKYVSIHPAFYSLSQKELFNYVDKQLFQEFKYTNEEKKYFVEIGNDVWIGTRAMILEGVVIGDGAIIAAGSVVTSDVAPYTIVAGIPAKPIKKRFTDSEIKYLLKEKWWDNDECWIRDNAYYFNDIEKFMKNKV